MLFSYYKRALCPVAILAALVLVMTGCQGKSATGAEATAAPVETAEAAVEETAEPAEVTFATPSIEQDFAEPATEETTAEPLFEDLTETLGLTGDSMSFAYDLNGDGSAEAVTIEADEAAYTTTVTIGGTLAEDGAFDSMTVLDSYYAYAKVYAGDADITDGAIELYLTGDIASGDYMTAVFRVSGGGIVLETEVDGEVCGVDSHGHVILSEVVDVFGTHYGTCEYRLEASDAGITLTRDSVYTLSAPDAEWDMLTLQYDMEDVEAYRYDASEDGTAGYEDLVPDGTCTLPAGTVLSLAYTDQETFAMLQDAEGRLYRVTIQFDPLGYQWRVHDNSEAHWFGDMNYAG